MAKKKVQTACKPGSVSVPGRMMAIHLGRPLPSASRDLPGRAGRKHSPAGLKPPLAAPIRSCSRWGLPCRTVTGAAVRSYRTLSPLPAGRSCTGPGGLLSVALSLGSPPPGVTRHRVSVEPGLSVNPTVSHSPANRSSVSRSATPSTRAGRKVTLERRSRPQVVSPFRNARRPPIHSHRSPAQPETAQHPRPYRHRVSTRAHVTPERLRPQADPGTCQTAAQSNHSPGSCLRAGATSLNDRPRGALAMACRAQQLSLDSDHPGRPFEASE